MALYSKPISTGWKETILICEKCSKKLSGGFGSSGKEPLRKALRSALKEMGLRGKVGLIPVKCFGVCPKRAVTIVYGSAPGKLYIVPEGASTKTWIEEPDQQTG